MSDTPDLVIDMTAPVWSPVYPDYDDYVALRTATGVLLGCAVNGVSCRDNFRLLKLFTTSNRQSMVHTRPIDPNDKVHQMLQEEIKGDVATQFSVVEKQRMGSVLGDYDNHTYTALRGPFGTLAGCAIDGSSCRSIEKYWRYFERMDKGRDAVPLDPDNDTHQTLMREHGM